MVRLPKLAVLLAALPLATGGRAGALEIRDIIRPDHTTAAQQSADIKAATAYATFWNSGDVTLLGTALSADFIDHTLPTGRPQGPSGPAFASVNFRKAVPDLTVMVEKMIVVGDYVTVHMVFRGHFTGSFGSIAGHGQTIDFIATDLYHIRDGKIAEDWHLEDNLALLSEMGVASIKR
jgi:predicted ester cyclase